MPQHTLTRFDTELDQLKKHILSMGGMVERAIKNAVSSILEQNKDLAEKTIERDKAINALEIQSDEITRNILVRHQPTAGDLRFIVAAIKVVTDLERMGDLAAGIAEGTLRTLKFPSAEYSNLEIIGEKVLLQVNRSLDAYSRGDIDLAMEVIHKDRKIDKRYKTMYRELLTYMMEDPRSISSSIIMSNVAKNLERIADHAASIAEMVVYIIRGHDIRHVDHKEATRLLNEKD